MATKKKCASYPLKIQVIRSKGQNLRFYVYMPMPLAAAIGIEGGENVQWELLDRQELRLVRCDPDTSKTKQSFKQATRGGGPSRSGKSR